MSFLLTRKSSGRDTVKLKTFMGRPCTAALITPVAAPL